MNSILLQHKETIKRNQIALDKFIAGNHGDYRVGNRKLKAGIGINNAEYSTNPQVNGKTIMCIFYRTWSNMLERCYSDKYQEAKPTYIGCTVCNDWLNFMNFKSWMKAQNYKNNQLDKDLLFAGNKFYSPETCMFVSSRVNGLMNSHDGARGDFPLGVSFHQNRYVATVNVNGESQHLGRFKTVEKAESEYIKAKTAYIMIVALEQTDKKVMNALINQASHMVDNLKSLI